MKIFAAWSAPYRALLEEWFLPTLPRDMEPILHELPGTAEPGAGFRTPEWCAALDQKLSWVCEILRRHEGELICLSDVDVQFFGSFREELLAALEGHDLVAMREAAHEPAAINGGFVAVRCGPAVLALWEEALAIDKSAAQLYDQDALNALLDEPGHGLRVRLLPDHYWAAHRHLIFHEPEPATILVHHATGPRDKPAELRRVRDHHPVSIERRR